ncbi:hypothetical protein PTKIN_Ptkin06aG0149400 [Pterospermum kingtungense]
MYNENGNVEERTEVSALHVNETFLQKILARDDNSFLDNSLGVPYRRSVGQVPFRWESQPGTPRDQLVPSNEIAPPVGGLPPASSWNSQKGDMPCMDMSRETRGCFWKKSNKRCQGEVKSQGNIESDNYCMYSSSTNSKSSSSKLRNLAKVLLKWPF